MKGHVAKKGKRYYPVVDIGRDANGKRKQQWHKGHATKKEADQELRAILTQLDNGTYVAPNKRTLADFIEQDWLPSLSSDLRPGTVALHELNCRAYIIPALGGKALQNVTPRDLAALKAQLLDSGRRDGEGLSVSAVTNIWKTLRGIFRDAQRLGLRQNNPVENVKAPKRSTGKDDSSEIETWTADEMRQFLETAGDDRLFAAWLLAATTGMRRGEILGLRWSDISLARGEVAIHRTLVLVKNKPTWSEPKTRRSRRSIPLSPEAVSALRAHRVAQAEDRLLLGEGYEDDDLVFCHPNGTPIHPGTFTDYFHRISKRAGIPRRTFHAVRHTFATLALETDVHIKVVSEILGHSSVAITLDTYSHATPALQKEATSKVTALFLGSR